MNIGQITVMLGVDATTDLLFRAAKALRSGSLTNRCAISDEILSAMVSLDVKSTAHVDRGDGDTDPQTWVREATVTLARFLDAAAPRSDARAQAMDRAGETGEVVMQRDMGAAVARERLRTEFEEWYLRDCCKHNGSVTLRDIIARRTGDSYTVDYLWMTPLWKGFKAARGCA